MQQADQPVLVGNLFHHFHGQLVVIDCQVAGGEDGGELMLAGSYLVVLGLGQDAELPQLFIKFTHEGRHPALEVAEVVVFQLLAFRRSCP
ncbi:hypothetical protein DSECCO2_661050 [anaerobic digester metagenome]